MFKLMYMVQFSVFPKMEKYFVTCKFSFVFVHVYYRRILSLQHLNMYIQNWLNEWNFQDVKTKWIMWKNKSY